MGGVRAQVSPVGRLSYLATSNQTQSESLIAQVDGGAIRLLHGGANGEV